ncbi:MAG: hypothetical protein ACK4NC_07515 [Candidatus Gracilibacteria bacterium]
MLAQLADIVQNAHQDMYVYSTSLGSPYDFETQRIWLADLPNYPQPARLVRNVRVQFANLVTDVAQVYPHPLLQCRSIVRTVVYPAPLTRVFVPQVFFGRYEDFVQIYSASNTLFPFLFVLDKITSETDYNVLHISDFTILFAGLINREDSLGVSNLNIVAQYFSKMFLNVDIKVKRIEEYARIAMGVDTFEIYVQAFSCERYLKQKYI